MIAIVDDQQSLCRLSVILKKKGFDVVFTGNSGEEFLEAIARGELTKDNLDFILIDYGLGNGIDGLATARRVTELIPTVKVVIVSADYSIRARVLAAGFSFISKPFSVPEFLKCLVKEEPDKKESGLRKRASDFSLAIEEE